jgi:hypothetical protein
MAGKTTKVFISNDGTSGGSMIEIENQGDLSLNLGKPLNRTSYKNGSVSAQGEDGISGSFTMGLKRPAGTGQALVLAAHDNVGECYLEIKDSVTGGQKWVGDFLISLTSVNEPTDGEHEYTVEFSENGTITRSAV